MPGVVSVQPKTGGLLSQVMQGVQVARDVYGIKHDMAASDLTEQRAQQEQQQFEQNQRGELPAAQKVAAARYGSFSENPSEGSTLVKFVGDKSPTYYTPYKDSQLVKAVDDNGSPVYQYVSRGDQPVQAYEAPKEAKTPTPHITALGQDADGNMVTLDTTTGHTSTVPMGGPITKVGGKAEDPGKAAAAAEKVYTELGQRIENPRGNKAVQTAQLNLLNVDNAKGLLSKYKNNLDAMPPNDVALLVADISKISTGGVGSQHSQEGIAASTLQSKLAGFMQQVGGQPNGAQLGAFLKNNQDYLNELEAVSTKRINDYKMAIYNSYKNRLPEELQQRFQAEHGDLFPNGAPAPNAAPTVQQGGGIVGTATAATGGGGGHPQDAQAIQWANQNVMSPDAAKAAMARQILQLNGVK